MLRIVFRCLLVASALLGLLGCASHSAWSERQVLPEFSAGQLAQRRLLLAPFSVADVNPERSIPLDDGATEGASQAHQKPDGDVASLEAFYAAGARGGADTLRRSGTGLNLLTVDGARWTSYFEHPESFLDVTVDGKSHYQVPSRELLRTLGVDADFALVLTALEYYSKVTTTKIGNSVTRDRTLSGNGKFLVWDYQRARALAEGSVNAAVGFDSHGITGENVETLGADLVGEILAKRPFVR